MNQLQVWVYATRPKTLVIGVSPVLIGATLAISQGYFDWITFLFTLITAMCIQIGANLANDYFDFKRGSDTEKRKGFLRVIPAGLATPQAMKRAFITAFSLAFLSGCYLIWKGGVPIACTLVVSIFLGIIYTGGPYPLSYLGIAEFFTLLFFGPIAVLGTYYLQTQSFAFEPFLVGFAPGAFSMAVLVVNNVRDVDEDREAQKKTLPVRLGKTFGKCEYLFALSIPFLLVIPFYRSHPFILLTLLLLIPSLPLMRKMVNFTDPRELNPLLAKTGQLEIIYTLLFCIGWML